MKKTAIVVAGGQGVRMGSGLPKQFLHLGGQPLLMHTIDLFHRYDKSINIVVGLAENYMSYWEDLCRQLNFTIPHRKSPGGETRFHTVQKALQEVAAGSIVAIHDAVRPLVTRETINRCFDTARRSGAAIPCVDVPESLREVGQGKSKWVDRRSYRLVQTPQVFQYEILINAYQQSYEDAFTDDASVVEKAGYDVALVAGNHENVKITTPEDLIFAESILSSYREKSGLF
jgi:2-C-methyl-D-erythritol 4-phosphate cytidylyltransferase